MDSNYIKTVSFNYITSDKIDWKILFHLVHFILVYDSSKIKLCNFLLKYVNLIRDLVYMPYLDYNNHCYIYINNHLEDTFYAVRLF